MASEKPSAPVIRRRTGWTDDRRPTIFLMTDALETGGIERQFSLLIRSLNPDLFRVRVGCLKRQGPFLEGLGQVEEFSVGGSFLTLQAQRARIALWRSLRAQRVAVAHSFDFYSNMMLIPVARVAGVPVVIGSQQEIGDLLTPLQFGAQGLMFRLSDRVMCNSRAVANRLVGQGLPEDKLVIIPNGIAREAFDETTPALPRQPGMLRVGIIARMNHPVKNHALFLRAAARLARKLPSVEFVLVGDGPLRAELERTAAQLGLGSRVRFLGDRRDMWAVLASIDVSVLPSSSESLPNAVLESMAAGVPVVASRVGGIPEAVIDGVTGLLFPAGDEAELVGALERLLEQPSLRVECGRRSRELARANFSLDQMRGRFEQLYTSLLREKGWLPERQHLGESPAADLCHPLKLAIVAVSPRWVGGQSVQAELLIHCWRNDPSVDANFIPIDPMLPRPLKWVEQMPYLRTLVREPFYLASLWNKIRDADVVHIFSASYWSFLLTVVPAWVISRVRGKKILINYHSAEARDHLRRWPTARFILRRADRVVVPSRYLVDVFSEFGVAAQSVPNIVDLDQFLFRERNPLRPWLVNTRGFHPYYSVDAVIRAFACVKKEFPAAHLCLVGKGTLEREIRALVDHMRLTDVKFAGAVPHHQMGRFYDQADIFVNASWLDNMPISILEAFASGAPVVTTAAEGIRYLVEHERTGLLCQQGDWKALAANVIRLLHDPSLASYLAHNAHEESKKYCWEAVRREWLRLYDSLLASSTG